MGESVCAFTGHRSRKLPWGYDEQDARCVAVVVCFAAFLLGDMYGFLSWRRMGKRQATALHGASDR